MIGFVFLIKIKFWVDIFDDNKINIIIVDSP